MPPRRAPSTTAADLLRLLLPLVVGFYIVLSILEDSGYLPRLATLVDRQLGSNRERTIATANLLLISTSNNDDILLDAQLC